MSRKSIAWALAILLICGVAAGFSLVVKRRAILAGFPEDCLAAERDGNWQALTQIARQWTTLAPQQSQAWVWLGKALRHEQKYPEAISALAQIPIDAPKGIEAGLGRLSIQSNILKDAEAALETSRLLLARNPRLPEPRNYCIFYYAITHQEGELLREIRSAIEHRSDLPKHYAFLMTLESLEYQGAEEAASVWLKSNPNSKAMAAAQLVYAAQDARRAKKDESSPENDAKYAECVKQVQQAHEASPHNPVYLGFLMQHAMDCHDLDAMSVLLSAVPESASENPVFWRYRGWYEVQTGEPEKAIKTLEHGLELFPMGWRTRHECARALRAADRKSTSADMQTLASRGATICEGIRERPDLSISYTDFMEIQSYAAECGDWRVADGLSRRIAEFQ